MNDGADSGEATAPARWSEGASRPCTLGTEASKKHRGVQRTPQCSGANLREEHVKVECRLWWNTEYKACWASELPCALSTVTH